MLTGSNVNEELDIMDPQFLRKEILLIPGVIHTKKVVNRIIRKYDIYLEYHESRSLSVRVSAVLKELQREGKLDVFSINSSKVIKYLKSNKFQVAEV